MTTIGVLGGDWRAMVSPGGAVRLSDGSPELDWHVAADDRWHSPATEPTVRQTCVEGTPVVETRVRIPSGDALQRVYAVAGSGGLVVVEIENDSPLPIAVAFTRGDVLSARPPAAQPIRGIDLPPGSVLFPVGHHATLKVALSPDGATQLPTALPPVVQVAGGWTSMSARASRVGGVDEAWELALVRERCAVALEGPDDEHPVDLLLGIGELVRMGEAALPWVLDVADAVERAAPSGDWALPWALDAAARVMAAAGERRARRDVLRLRGKALSGAALSGAVPETMPAGIRAVPWIERRFAALVGGAAWLLPYGFEPAWLGASFECHGIPVGPSSSVSFAVRWHGDRPAVLWEVDGDPIDLTAPAIASAWRTSDPAGETLWPAPATAMARSAAESPSFG